MFENANWHRDSSSGEVYDEIRFDDGRICHHALSLNLCVLVCHHIFYEVASECMSLYFNEVVHVEMICHYIVRNESKSLFFVNVSMSLTIITVDCHKNCKSLSLSLCHPRNTHIYC